MYKITITKQDQTIYWIEYSNSLEDAQKWVSIEQTRPYWDNTFIVEIENTAPQLSSEQLLEEAWIVLRNKRNQLLAECDWTQLEDAPLNADQKLNWQIYREALRDIPNTIQDPNNAVWPIKP